MHQDVNMETLPIDPPVTWIDDLPIPSIGAQLHNGTMKMRGRHGGLLSGPVPPNVFIGTVGPDLDSARRLSPSVTGVHALGVSFGGDPSCYSSWGTSFPSIPDYIHISVIM